MYNIHILTPGFTTPNGRAFLFPLLVHKRALKAAGLRITLHQAVTPALYDCDVLFVDSKFHRDLWMDDTTGILEEFSGFRDRIGSVIYCDTTDSTGWVQVELLPLVDLYAKAQLLKDRRGYLVPHYGHRIYADYYHRVSGVADDQPEFSTPVKDEALLGKLALSWNSGLADYSLLGPYRMAAYERLPLPSLLGLPRVSAYPEDVRPVAVQMRMGLHYNRASVSYQRQQIARKLEKYRHGDKLRRWRYWRELCDSRLVLSPFGLGEITLKDYEVFLTGGCLVKPDVSHMETWPDFFRPNETIACFSWDLENLESVIDDLLRDTSRRLALAATGQKTYMKYQDGRESGALFASHLSELVQRAQKR
ncbi:glycosyltransferase [Ferrovibrio terrae]|uniref:glycosyltransferase family protein n=1 Tax=Ferrovibrio terrae TaxID=2594003 RepID=UPI003137A992